MKTFLSTVIVVVVGCVYWTLKGFFKAMLDAEYARGYADGIAKRKRR